MIYSIYIFDKGTWRHVTTCLTIEARDNLLLMLHGRGWKTNVVTK